MDEVEIKREEERARSVFGGYGGPPGGTFPRHVPLSLWVAGGIKDAATEVRLVQALVKSSNIAMELKPW